MENATRDRTGRRAAGGALLLLLTLLSLGCDGLGAVDVVELIEVTFANDVSNNDSIHIFGPGEGFDASNRLDPGQVRIATFRQEFDRGERATLTFTAGRNGQVLATAGCVVQRTFGTGALVLWDGGALVCGGTFE